VQNKVLEAMAMGRPVVAARSCVDAIDAEHGEHLFGADAESDYVRHIVALATDAAFADRIGQAGRDCVLQRYSWAARLAELDRHLKPRARDAQAGHEVGEVVSREVGAV
jgi:glycosyltransferase involved in cell wall biosynthesis